MAPLDNYDCVGLGKRGGTMHSKPYGQRSDSNGAKHKVSLIFWYLPL